MIYFTSDTHYGHENIIKYCNRPFADTTEMARALIDNWNKVVGPDDTVIHVGDVFFHLTDWEMSQTMQQLNGNKILVRGNHDRGPARMRNLGFSLVLEEFKFVHDNIKFTVSHYPYRRTNVPYDEKHVNKRPEDVGDWLIHGHVHDRWKKKNRMINVSVEVWDYTPVSLEQICAHIRGKD